MLRSRKSGAAQVGKEIVRVGIHRPYIPDFLDPTGTATPAGSFFAAHFSQLIGESSKKIEIASRVEIHRYLEQKGWTDSDLSQADVQSSIRSQFSLDGILFGTLSEDRTTFTIDLTMRNSMGAELFRTQYQEKIDLSVLAFLPFGAEQSDPSFISQG